MKLIDERLEALRTGEVVRIPVPELGGDVLMVLALPDETTERVLEETLEDVRVKRGWAELGRQALARRIREDAEGNERGPTCEVPG